MYFPRLINVYFSKGRDYKVLTHKIPSTLIHLFEKKNGKLIIHMFDYFLKMYSVDPCLLQMGRDIWFPLACSESESEVVQSCPSLCDPIDCSPSGSSVHGIFQARILEWVAMPSSRRSSHPRDWTQVSHNVGRCLTVWASREVLGMLWTYLYSVKFEVISLGKFRENKKPV